MDEILIDLQPYFIGRALSVRDVPCLMIGTCGVDMHPRMAIMELEAARSFVGHGRFVEHYPELILAPTEKADISLSSILEKLDVPRLKILIIAPNKPVKEISFVDLERVFNESLLLMQNTFPFVAGEIFDEVPFVSEIKMKNDKKIIKKPLNKVFNNKSHQNFNRRFNTRKK